MVCRARWTNQPSAGHSETAFVVEAGYYLTPNLRLSAGYVFGEVDNEGFSGSRSAGGPYVGFTVKLNELFDGFELQKRALPQKKGSPTKLVTSQATNRQKLQKRLSRRLSVQPTQEASSNAAVSPESTLAKAGETP